MGAVLMGLLRWFGTVGAGWMVSDIYNEQQRKKQLAVSDNVQPPSIVDTAKNVFKANWLKYAIVAAIALIIIYVVKPKK